MAMRRKTFDWERRMQPHMDRVYLAWGFKVDRSSSCKEYDAVLKKGGRRIRVEEKYLFTEKKYDQMVVELVQDIVSGDLGWFYHTGSDWLVWIYCPPDHRTPPRDFWIIKLAALRNVLFGNLKESKSITSYIVNEHYGVTLNVPVKFADLEDAAKYYRYADFAPALS